MIICNTLHQTFYVAHCAGFLEGCKFFSQEGGLGPTRITIFPEKSLDFKSIGCTLKRSRLMILNQVFFIYKLAKEPFVLLLLILSLQMTCLSKAVRELQ